MNVLRARLRLHGYDFIPRKQSGNSDGSLFSQKSLWGKISDSWALEIGGFFVGFLCLSATVSLLCFYDDKAAPNWPITLNFALSVIGNVGFAATLFGVHSAVGQYKWIIFSKSPRPLSQLGIFQRAHRGSLSAFELLYELGGHVTIAFGALAILLGMFWGPFTQNLIYYESGMLVDPDNVALLARNVYYRGRGPVFLEGLWEPDPMLQFNMLNSIAAAPNLDVNIPDFICPTGNCTWPIAATLGFCSQCTDLTPEMVLDCEEHELYDVVSQKCVARIPDSGCSIWTDSNQEMEEAFLNITLVDMPHLGHASTLRYHSIRRITPGVLLDGGIVKGGNGTDKNITRSDFAATECWLRPCVRSFEASVSTGIYTERIIDTYMNGKDQPWDTILQPPWGGDKGIHAVSNGANLTTFSMAPPLDPNSTSAAVNAESYNRIFKSLEGWVETWGQRSGFLFHSAFNNGSSERFTIGSSMLSVILFNNFDPSECGSPNNDTFACVMDTVAQSITKTIRNSGMKARRREVVSQEDAVFGTIYTAATFIRVQWYWIGLPAAVWGLGMLSWVIIALRSHRMQLPAWRDDILPLIFLYNGGIRSGEETSLVGQLGGNWRRGGLARGISGTMHPEHHGILKADRQSSWAYEKVADGITVQVKRTEGGRMAPDGPLGPMIRLEQVQG